MKEKNEYVNRSIHSFTDLFFVNRIRTARRRARVLFPMSSFVLYIHVYVYVYTVCISLPLHGCTWHSHSFGSPVMLCLRLPCHYHLYCHPCIKGWAEAEAEAEFLAQGVLDLNQKAAGTAAGSEPSDANEGGRGGGGGGGGMVGPAAAAAAAAAKARRNSLGEGNAEDTDGPTLSSTVTPAAAAGGGGGGAMAGIPANPFKVILVLNTRIQRFVSKQANKV